MMLLTWKRGAICVVTSTVSQGMDSEFGEDEAHSQFFNTDLPVEALQFFEPFHGDSAISLVQKLKHRPAGSYLILKSIAFWR